jgi:hypothetical protein
MSTEVEEMLDAIDNVNMLEECGDFSWYQAIYEAAVPETIDPLFSLYHAEYTQDVLLVELRRNVGSMMDHSKKVLMYGKSFDKDSIKLKMNICFFLVNQLISLCGGTVEKVRETNIKKLSARYPEQFTDYHAENRDLTTERIILEEGIR